VLIHNCADESIVSAAEIVITPDITSALEFHEPWPRNHEEVDDFLRKMQGPVEAKVAGLIVKMGGSAAEHEVKQLVKLEALKNRLLRYEDRGDVEWVAVIGDEDNPGFRVRPLYARKLYREFMESMGKRVWLTSATMPTPAQMHRWLGVPADAVRIAVPSPFDLDNRRVQYCPAGNMSYKTIRADFPRIVRRIDQLLTQYKDFKGIIHTNSFKIADMLDEHITGPNHRRLTVQRPDSNRDELLEQHRRASYPSVLVSPSMTEGVDLKDDLARFAIFAKVPYPNLGDQWVARRRDDDPEWYAWTTMKSIVQGAGRIVRHAGDWGDTFIVDGSFGSFWDRNRHLAPKWFQEAVK
jgi:Rad3-related DNA helicase